LKVWILQTGEPLQIDEFGIRPMRAINLSNILAEQGHEVVVWTSDFNHFTKSHRYGKFTSIKYSNNLSFKLIYSSGYKSNQGIKRLIDHAQLGLNLYRQIRKEELPDIAFIGYPPIETAWLMNSYLRRRDTPTIIDVKDAWPETLLRAIPSRIKLIGKLLLLPYFLMMKKTLQSASAISAPTEEFLDWCLSQANRIKSELDLVLPLTSPDLKFTSGEIEKASDWLKSQGIKIDGSIKVTFIGTLNSAFDFNPVIYAAKSLPYQFIIAGDGPNFESIKNATTNLKNVYMLGWIDACTVNELSKISTVMFAPLHDLDDFKMSIPNKFYDYMRLGKPVLTSISGITGKLIQTYNIGEEYSSSNISTFAEKLEKICSDPKLIEVMSENSRSLYQNEYNFNRVYGQLVLRLAQLIEKNKV